MKKFKTAGRPASPETMAQKAIVSFMGQETPFGRAALGAGAVALARQSTPEERVDGKPHALNGVGFSRATAGDGLKVAGWVLGGVSPKGEPYLPKPISDRWLTRAQDAVRPHLAQLGRLEVAIGAFSSALAEVEDLHNLPGLVAAFEAVKAEQEAARLAPAPQPQAQPRRAQGRPPAELAHALVRPGAHALVRPSGRMQGNGACQGQAPAVPVWTSCG